MLTHRTNLAFAIMLLIASSLALYAFFNDFLSSHRFHASTLCGGFVTLVSGLWFLFQARRLRRSPQQK
jgi:hypothetical protein